MAIDQKFLPQEQKLMDFVARKEPWAEFQLEDGTIVRARLVLSKVIDTGEFGEDGFPVHALIFQQLLDLTWPKHVIAEAAARRRPREDS